jgi:hypothetical protein
MLIPFCCLLNIFHAKTITFDLRSLADFDNQTHQIKYINH